MRDLSSQTPEFYTKRKPWVGCQGPEFRLKPLTVWRVAAAPQSAPVRCMPAEARPAQCTPADADTTRV
ncbi:unnamed protein product [Closterium sp. NIES-54]